VKSPALTIAAALLFFAANASAQKEEQPLPKNLPPFGPEKPLQAPAAKASKLDNGLTVWLVPQPGFPKVSLALAILGGLPADPKDHPGLSQLLTATIDQGTKSRTARQIAEQLQAAGGDLSANVARDSIRITTGVLASKAADGLAILADIAQNATFPDNEVDLAKRNLSDSLDLQEADPNFLANRAMARVLYGDSPYSIVSPTKQSLAAMTPADLRADFARRVRPDQALLVIVGDLSSDQMLSLAREKFGSWRAPASPAATVPPPPQNPPPHSIFFVARPESVQTTLSLAAFGPKRSDPDFEAAEVANAIYGGTFGSRLTTNIREDKGYTYTPGSFLQTFRASGTIRTGADVRNAVTAPTLNEIFYEMNRLATTTPTDRELQQAKRYLVGIEAIQLQSRDAVAGELASLWTKNLPPEEIGAYGQKITATTAEQVDAAARKYFPASRATIVAVGEEKVIRDSLSTFGLPINPAP
jgi:zinc protease